MDPAAIDLAERIRAMSREYDGLPDSATDRKADLEQRIRAARDQLDELLPPHKPGEPARPEDRVPLRDANVTTAATDAIGTVEDVLGTQASQDRDRARQLKEIDDRIAQEQAHIDYAQRNPSQDSHDTIQDSTAIIKDLERQKAALDPTAASLDLFADSAEGALVDDVVKQRQAERAEAEAKQAIADATAAVERGAHVANRGDLEQAVLATSGGLPDPAAMDNARSSDDMIRKHGCTLPVVAGISIAVIIAVIVSILTLGGDDGSSETATCDRALGLGTGELALPAQEDPCASSTTEAGAAPGGGAGPPAEADLPKDAILFTGTSGDNIGCIGCDGQSRFLSLEQPGVGVGNQTMVSKATPWEMDGQVLEFGARLTAPNKGRYGVNLWIDNAEYGPGVALEVGQQSAVYRWHPERDGPLKAGSQVAIIVGEGGVVDDEGVPTAQGDYQLEWWFVFQPA